MNAEELKRYDAYPLLVAALKRCIAPETFYTEERGDAARAASDLLRALGEKE